MVTSFSQFKKWAICLTTGLCMALCTNAQIGYQISLLNTATGEPRANETVNVTATITDSSGGVIWTGTQSVTSNDFGVLSLTVGNADTFTNLDLQEHRLPFFIEVSANGAMISRSQILSVPVAEVARQLEPGIKVEDIVGTWGDDYYHKGRNYIFYDNGISKAFVQYDDGEIWASAEYDYYIEGNSIYLYMKGGYNSYFNPSTHFRYKDGTLWKVGAGTFKRIN